MKTIPVLLSLLLMASACATTAPREQARDESPEPQQQVEAPAQKNPPAVTSERPPQEPYPMADLMPFGTHPLGRWTLWETQRNVPRLGLGRPPDPDAPITVDFVRDGSRTWFVKKDIHTVLHWIALKSGLQIIVEGKIRRYVTFAFPAKSSYSIEEALELVRRVCRACGLECAEDGRYVIIRNPRAFERLYNIIEAANARYDANFESHPLVDAIMEVAVVTNTDVYVPAKPVTEEREDGGEERGVLVTFRAWNATPDTILRKLAELGGLTVRVEEEDGRTAYFFQYPPEDE